MAGFTLVELMVAVLMLAILAGIAAPTFTRTVKTNQVESTLRELAGALALARTEAASRGVPVVLCRTNDGATCADNATVATDGWLIFEDTDKGSDNNNSDLDGGETLLRVHDNLTKTRLSMVDAPPSAAAFTHIRFDRNGFSNLRGTLEVCEMDQDPSFARALLIENTGRIARARLNAGTGFYQDIGGADLTCP